MRGHSLTSQQSMLNNITTVLMALVFTALMLWFVFGPLLAPRLFRASGSVPKSRQALFKPRRYRLKALGDEHARPINQSQERGLFFVSTETRPLIQLVPHRSGADRWLSLYPRHKHRYGISIRTILLSVKGKQVTFLKLDSDQNIARRHDREE